MKIILKRRLVTNFTDKRINQTYEIITQKFECEPNYIFEKRKRRKRNKGINYHLGFPRFLFCNKIHTTK